MKSILDEVKTDLSDLADKLTERHQLIIDLLDIFTGKLYEKVDDKTRFDILKIMYYSICITGGLGNLNILSHMLILILIQNSQNIKDFIYDNIFLYLNCQSQYVETSQLLEIIKHRISSLYKASLSKNKRTIIISSFNDNKDILTKFCNKFNLVIPEKNLETYLETIERNIINKNESSTYKLNNSPIINNHFIQHFVSHSFPMRPFFDYSHNIIIPGAYHKFGTRMIDYTINTWDILYGKFLLKLINPIHNSDHKILDEIISLIKYFVGTHNMFYQWNTYIDKFDEKIKDKFFENDKNFNKILNTVENRKINRNQIDTSVTNLLTSLFLVADCREHNYSLSFLFTLYKQIQFSTIIANIINQTNNHNYDPNSNLIFELSKIIQNQMRTAHHKILFNARFSSGELNSYGLKRLEPDDNNNNTDIYIFTNNTTIKTTKNEVASKYFNSNSFNCTLLFSHVDHVFNYLYYVGKNYQEIITKDALCNNLFVKNIPDKFFALVDIHNKIITINDIKFINTDEIALISLSSMSRGIRMNAMINTFSYDNFFTSNFYHDGIYYFNKQIEKNNLIFTRIMDQDIQKANFLKEIFPELQSFNLKTLYENYPKYLEKLYSSSNLDNLNCLNYLTLSWTDIKSAFNNNKLGYKLNEIQYDISKTDNYTKTFYDLFNNLII